MTATRHVPPAPPATRLAVAAVLVVLVATCGAGLGGAAAGPVAGAGVLAALALAVPAGWWLAARVTPAWGRETDRPGQAEARALAGWACSDGWRVSVGAAVGGAVLLAAAGLTETRGALVALGLAALALAALGGVAGVAVVATAVVAVACRRGGMDVASATAGWLRCRRRRGGCAVLRGPRWPRWGRAVRRRGRLRQQCVPLPRSWSGDPARGRHQLECSAGYLLVGPNVTH